jgi:predicted nucleotide-binding protein
MNMGEQRQPKRQNRRISTASPSRRQRAASRPGLDDVGDGRMPRPRVFIGSSSSGKEVARAIQSQLNEVADAEVWDEGVFGLTLGTLESLVQALDIFDFAVLVLTPDDLLVSGKVKRNTPRDNVLLELGLFIGRLGRSRTFVVCQQDSSLKLPSDLAGATLASFNAPQDPERLRSAVGPACTRIRDAIRSQQKGAAVQELQADLHNQQNQINKQQLQITNQRKIINQLVVFSMAYYIFYHLKGIYHAQRNRSEYLFRKDFEQALRYLRDAGYIESVHIGGLADGENLVDKIKLTPVGNFYVETREDYEKGGQPNA